MNSVEPVPGLSARRLVGLFLLGVALVAIYLLTASQQYDADVLGELKDINHLDTSSPDPAHMLYVRIGVPVYRLWRTLGYGGDALWPMQVLNALLGGSTLLLFALTLRRFSTSWSLVLVTSGTAGLSYAWWTHVVDAFFIVPAALFSIFALLCAVELSLARTLGRSVLLAAGLAIGLSLAALTYQTNILLVPALFVASWPVAGRRIATSFRNWLAVSVLIILVAGGAWLLQGIQHAGVQDAREFFQWLAFGHGGIQRGLWRREGVNPLTTVPVAWLATVLPVYEGLGLRPLLSGVVATERIPSQLALVLMIFVGSYVLVAALVRRKAIWKGRRRRGLLVSALWFAVPGVAVVWFDPAEVKLWLIPMFGLWMALAIVLPVLVPAGSQKGIKRSLALVLLTALAVLIPISNLLVPIWPNHVFPSEKLLLAQESIRHLEPDDLLLSAGFDWTGYVEYVSDEHRVVNAIAIAQFYGKDAVKPKLWERMDATWAQGGHVYIVDYFSADKSEMWSSWITPFTLLSPENFDRFRPTVAWTMKDQVVWELLPPR